MLSTLAENEFDGATRKRPLDARATVAGKASEMVSLPIWAAAGDLFCV